MRSIGPSTSRDGPLIMSWGAGVKKSFKFFFSNLKKIQTFKNSTTFVITLIMPVFIITTLCIVGLFSPFNATLDRIEKVLGTILKIFLNNF